MIDEQFFHGICEADCTLEELRSFCLTVEEREFDLDNAFEKYYSLRRILQVIDRYESGQISAKFLAYWACAYDWIIMSGFKIPHRKSDRNYSIKEIVVYEIADWLDSLSFFDEDCRWDMIRVKDTLVALDEIYQNAAEWEIEYARTNEYCDDDGDVWILFINVKRQRYVKIFFGACGEYTIEEQEPWTEKDIEKAIQCLIANGYQKLPYGLSDEEEDEDE